MSVYRRAAVVPPEIPQRVETPSTWRRKKRMGLVVLWLLVCSLLYVLGGYRGVCAVIPLLFVDWWVRWRAYDREYILRHEALERTWVKGAPLADYERRLLTQGYCPDCGHPFRVSAGGIGVGANGGLASNICGGCAVNIYCSRGECGSGFNFIEPFTSTRITDNACRRV